ncbi:hypothetical protein JTE90_001700 [Oedothorax gibbosus]|uniref:Uncharacterized protein n=1 Tax=Oedothorax gibbosus TaxID=931172 RepID=A0AAV6TKY4_9ARAC|nr:hypothetical protein JTE90_001700 [Oedothorax gibbosus]
MAKNLKHIFVLIHFYEESKYSVERLKDVIVPPTTEFFQEDCDLQKWDTSKTVEVPWNGLEYPARFLQFGDSKKEMEMLLDDLVEGKLSLSDVPLLQIAGGSTASKQKIKVVNAEKNERYLL